MVSQSRRRLGVFLTLVTLAGVALLGAFLAQTPALAQQPTPTPAAASVFPITFSGPVESVGPRFLVVNGLLVDLSGVATPLPAGLQVGDLVTVSGSLSNNTIMAEQVQSGATQPGGQAAAPRTSGQAIATPRPADQRGTASGRSGRGDDDARRIVIQGPVRQVMPDSLRIFNLDVQFDPTVVNVANIRVGDYVRVEGDFMIVNNVFTIFAVNAVQVNPPVFRGGSSRDSISVRDSGRVAPPPPAPPVRRGSNSGGSFDSGRGSVSAASGRGSVSS